MKSEECGLPYDYYWRDYTGLVPADAVEGGRDINNRTTYIGQVYLHKFGICPVTIYPGTTDVKPSAAGYQVWNYLKILCSSSKERFQWISTDADKLHVQMIGKHLVRGGMEDNGTPNNIGRILYKGELVVGRVYGSQAGDVKLHYLDDNYRKSTNAYEVLVYV